MTASRILLLIASAGATSSCALPGSNVERIALPPRLSVPDRVAEPCAVTAWPILTIADLEVRDRLRGLDVRECEGKRALAVQTLIEEHRLEDAQIAARTARNRSLWQRLTPWTE